MDNSKAHTGALKGTEAKLEQLRAEARLLDQLKEKRADPELAGPTIDASVLEERKRAQDELNRLLDEAPTAKVARLQVLSKEIILVLRQLDVMERRRLRDNAELLAAWKNARDIHWPRPEQKEKTEAA